MVVMMKLWICVLVVWSYEGVVDLLLLRLLNMWVKSGSLNLERNLMMMIGRWVMV